MTQVSHWWKHIRYWIQDLLIDLPLTRKEIRKMSRWLLISFGTSTMLLWNWKLVIATVSGVGLMLLVYFVQGWNWQAYLSHWRKFFTGSSGKLTVAVGSGGFAALSTYIAASIWADSENRWLATGTILQGFGTLLTLLLLVWHIIGDRSQQDEHKFEQLLQDLTASDPLKRLIAVRQLSNLIAKPRFRLVYEQQLVEYFCLLLSTEQEPLIREAVLKSLQKWGREVPKYQSDRSLQIPLDLKHTSKRVYREV
ncbi:MAG: ATP synthase subunit I [Hydrococcus sp. RM1_1_31]|nr:ATP synthase subunit I [Hydrococcus sp. RM1_1_31]